MIRRLLLLCALVALASESAYGVELGKLQLHSALNQRLDADIPLSNVEGLGPDEILAGLASSDEFDKVGLDRPFELTNLRFSVNRGQNGRMTVHITSTKPIVEPYLDFLMEVLWPNGRIVREYTILLDPPTFGKEGVQELNAPSSESSGSAASMQKPAPQPKEAPRPKPVPQPVAQPAPEPAPMVSHLDEGNLSSGKYGVTGPGDTLWKIAMKVRPNDSVSIQQTMLAIKRANQDDFIHDNINLLRAGRVLRIPDLTAMQQVSMASAVAEVKAQNEAFHTYKSTGSMPQINASPRNSEGQGAAGGNGGSGELRLLTARNTQKAAAAAAGGNRSASGKALQDQLDATQEDLDKTKRANSELNGKVNDLQAQITTLNNLVKLKDQQLATLQESLKNTSSQPANTQLTQQPKPAVQAPQQNQPQAQPKPAPKPQPQAQPPKPANPGTSSVVMIPKRQSFVQSLLTQPYVLIALGVVLIVLLAGGLFYMRRRGSDEMEVEFDDDGEGALDDDTLSDSDALAALSQDGVESQTSDVMSDADIFIAYSQFDEASSLLKNAIAADPDRADLRLKLLEVYIQTGDEKAFDEETAAIDALGDAAASQQARALKSHMFGGLGDDDGPAVALGLDDEEEKRVALASTGDDDDLSFDLDDLDAENEDTTLDLSMDDTSDDDVELSLDDADLDLDLAADGDDDGGLEELDLDLAADSDDGSAASGDGSAALDDDEFELNLDEDASTKLDLARAYIDMGDNDGARTVLQEVIEEGSDNEIQEANELLAKID